MEEQNKFINAITNDETFVDITENTKKRNQPRNLPKTLMANTSTFPSKSLVAEEFNRANYMYGNEEEKKEQGLSPKSAKIKSILKHRRTLRSIQMGYNPEQFEKKLLDWGKKSSILMSDSNQINKKITFSLPKTQQIQQRSKKTPVEVERKPNRISKTSEIPSRSSFKKDNLNIKINFNVISDRNKEKEIEKEREKISLFLNEDEEEEEDEEIKKEIKFQRDLHHFTKNQISYIVSFKIYLF